MKSSIPFESDRNASTKIAERALDRQQKALEGKALFSQVGEPDQMHHDHLHHIKAAHHAELANVTLLAKRQIHGARIVSRRARKYTFDHVLVTTYEALVLYGAWETSL